MLKLYSNNHKLSGIYFGSTKLITIPAILNGYKVYAIRWSDVYNFIGASPSTLISRVPKAIFKSEHKVLNLHNHLKDDLRPIFKTHSVMFGNHWAPFFTIISIHLCAMILDLYIKNNDGDAYKNLYNAHKLLKRLKEKYPNEVYSTYKNLSLPINHYHTNTLSPVVLRQRRFCLVYAITLNASKSYQIAYRNCSSARQNAQVLLAKPNIKCLVKKLYKKENNKIIKELRKERGIY